MTEVEIHNCIRKEEGLFEIMSLGWCETGILGCERCRKIIGQNAPNVKNECNQVESAEPFMLTMRHLYHQIDDIHP